MTLKTLKSVALAAACLAATAGVQAQTLLSEGFENVGALVLGANPWTIVNGSSLPVAPGFGQGDGASMFPAQSGSANSYAFSGFGINGSDSGGIYGLLITPVLDLSGDVTLSFWTRTVRGSTFPDRLSVGVLLDDGSAGELMSINYSLFKGAYPQRWTEYTLDLGGQGAGVTGSFYFEYYIEDASVAGNYIGLDTVTVQGLTLPPVPEPGTWLMMGLGLAGLGLLARRRA